MADKIYGLYPYQWQPPINGQRGYHYRPDGVIGGFDWRAIPHQGTSGQSSGYGFFAFAPGTAPSDLITIGIGDCREIATTPTMQRELRLKLGLSRDPAGAKLVDLVADICGPLSVPDGSTGVKTFMPTRLNEFDLHLAGHSKVFSRRINAAELLSNNPTGHANKIRDVMRKRYDNTFAEFGLDVTRKMLGEQLIRLGYHKDDVENGAPGKSSEWKRLLSPSLANRQGMRPAKPATTHTETWPNAAADVSATAQDQTWEVIAGFATCSATGSNTCGTPTKGTDRGVLCLSAVSSVDHTTSGVIASLVGGSDSFALARCRSGAATYYDAGIISGNDQRVRKYIAGVETILTNVAYAGTPAGSTVSCECDGSTITGTLTGASDQVVSDSAITDGVRGGVRLKSGGAATDSQMGTITISDNPVAPVAAFSGTPLSGTSPLSVAFTDASTNTPTSWLWEKSSDGGSNWSNFASGPTTQNPTESFTAGTWAVRLTATNAGGSDGETKLAYVVVTAAGGAGVSGATITDSIHHGYFPKITRTMK